MINSNYNYNKEFINCKKCGNEIQNNWVHCPKCHTRVINNGIRPFTIVLILLLIGLLIYYIYYYKNPNEDHINTFIPEVIEQQPVPMSPPTTGIYESFTSKDNIAPFKIINNKDDIYYFIKFKDIETGEEQFTIFLEKNTDLDILVPIGNYIVSVATGDTWYGNEIIFGPTTTYFDLRDSLEFTNLGFQTNGHILDFNKRSDGNLRIDYKTDTNF